ncbi:unnamed protein product, partial [Staurois parvus]
MPHISAHLSCLSVSHISANESQCCQSVHISAAYQFRQCHLSELPFSAACQCPSVMPVNAHQCHLPVPPISVHQCSLSVSISTASLAHISE